MELAGSDVPSQQPPAPAKHSSLPISRSTGTSYDRPERARTSHACEPCRERKTKCDGERPSCRRCMHTGTNCHYGYGKGWRKRKTAEDLTATSRRLARYEALLNEIMPHVPPNVKAMIDDARDQDMGSNSGGSETTENENQRNPPHLISDMGSSSGSRGSLPLPMPTLGAQTSLPHPPPLARPFEIGHPGSANSVNHRPSSPEDQSGARLPSITPHGMLIEPSLAAQTGSIPQVSSEPALYSQDRLMGSGGSPPHKPYAGQYMPIDPKLDLADGP